MNYSRKIFAGIIRGVSVTVVSALLCANCLPADLREPATVEQAKEVVVSAKTNFSFAEPTDTGVLTSAFGERNGRNHNGIDIGADANADIYAAEKGTVVIAEFVSGYGNYIEIDHGNGYSTAYAHCNLLNVEAGQQVEKGQLIALVGSTGNSTGPHLHFEIKRNGEFINPLEYVVY